MTEQADKEKMFAEASGSCYTAVYAILLRLYKAIGGPNYLQLGFKDEDGKRYYIRVQNCEGKEPEQIAAELLDERDAALCALDEYGRTNCALPYACAAAVADANKYRLEVEKLRGFLRECMDEQHENFTTSLRKRIRAYFRSIYIVRMRKKRKAAEEQ